MLTEGMYIADRYEIIGKIGAGGMSDVYKAKDLTLGRFVAIKVLKPEFSEDLNFVTKFRTEAQSAAGLEHPNIVNIYDVGSEKGMHYIVMEYVEGITLKTYIEKKGQLSFKEAVSIAIQVGRGIEAAHRKGIRTYVHDSNALPGKANRMTAKCCTNVLLGIEEARHYFNPAKCIVTGTPVRQEMEVRKDRREAREELNLPQDRRVVLVRGCVQGARNLNSLVIEAARQCAELCDFLIITGSADFERVSQLTADMPHVHVIEFCSAMASAYAAADVVVSRSGASSLTELAHMGKAALLVPYPFAADDHQAHNARVFAAHGAARMMRENTLTPDDIAAFLKEVFTDSALLASMNECALRLDMPDAVSRIANVIENTDSPASHD